MSDFIPVNVPVLGEQERENLVECVETGWVSSGGAFVSEFEEEMAARVDRQHGIAVANGSAALDVAVRALDLDPGAEVILPTFTIISCASAVVRAGATPVLADCDPETWNMTANQVAEKITPRTEAIMVVHIYGLPVDMEPIMALADEHDLHVIEDAAEVHGQTYHDYPCGSFGDLSTFSFYPNKHITTGEGGMVVTDDDDLAERCRSLRNLCFQSERRFVHEEMGWNYRMSNVQAALGVAQLERLDEVVEKKRAIGRRYDELLSDVPGIQQPLPATDYAENIYWVYGLVLDDHVPFDAAEAMDRLDDQRIGTRPFFWPMHEQPVFREQGLFEHDRHPVAERIARRGFYVPSGLALTNEQIETVADAVRSLMT
ncbi:DegT/DnrJ/EryC1/StrS family aminotransferase [Salinibacter ruber]|uniref:DegT/DnrJ/EryC1/StrS family aminotransferase n=1 Tax=Salinibacter ruber TaxID=146919 RepID=UPI0021673EC5|nr:DegT/DnrJ/EryC1/StrS family aminotransferase [Salinibacter ruber]MCS4054127.1 perosamine synthetase [Salinibacter ruber]